MIYLPGIKVAQGEPFDGEFTLTGQDWTGYSGTGTIKRKMGDEGPLVSFTPTGDDAGSVSYSLTKTQTAELPANDRPGFFAMAVGQVVMTNGTTVFTFQFPVVVAGTI